MQNQLENMWEAKTLFRFLRYIYMKRPRKKHMSAMVPTNNLSCICFPRYISNNINNSFRSNFSFRITFAASITIYYILFTNILHLHRFHIYWKVNKSVVVIDVFFFLFIFVLSAHRTNTLTNFLFVYLMSFRSLPICWEYEWKYGIWDRI